MKLNVAPGPVTGEVTIPASKSHTIRGLLLATLSEGTSQLYCPLRSSDTASCIDLCRKLGARVDDTSDEVWLVEGTSGQPKAGAEIDVGNSGTTLYLGMSVAALANGETTFTGDEQIQHRSAKLLMEALGELGADSWSNRQNGCAPLTVRGRMKGGIVTVECPTSQYLSSLLLGCPLADGDSIIAVSHLNEKPYVVMTLVWLDHVGVQYSATRDLSRIVVPGRQQVHAFEKRIPADFSSAAFFLVAAAVTGSRIVLRGLDTHDSQGDKAVLRMLEEMGCQFQFSDEGIAIEGPESLLGATFDLNATPDALPAMAVAGACAQGETQLINVPQAREKETDRISVMAQELTRMGIVVEELDDGIIIQGGSLRGANVEGHGDHRVVMALTVAGLAADGPTCIDTAEAVAVTFPTFPELMRNLGAEVATAD